MHPYHSAQLLSMQRNTKMSKGKSQVKFLAKKQPAFLAESAWPVSLIKGLWEFFFLLLFYIYIYFLNMNSLPMGTACPLGIQNKIQAVCMYYDD